MLRTKRPPKCKFCGNRTEAIGRMLCEPCVDPWLKREMEKKARRMERKLAEARRNERRRDRERKKALETVPKLKKECQKWFNKFTRLRDREKGCYVCLKPFPVGRLGGDFDAGHVRSCGSADHLRYTEDNCFGECKACNSSWGATQEQKEAGAVRRIGQERWDAVKFNNSEVKWTKDGLRELIATYKAKCKELERQK